MIHKRIIYHGRVQGVGFRYTAASAARGYDVCGYVKNQPNGTVLLEAEGDSGEVSGFLEDLGRLMGSNIKEAVEHDLPVTNSFERFDIKF